MLVNSVHTCKYLVNIDGDDGVLDGGDGALVCDLYTCWLLFLPWLIQYNRLRLSVHICLILPG